MKFLFAPELCYAPSSCTPKDDDPNAFVLPPLPSFLVLYTSNNNTDQQNAKLFDQLNPRIQSIFFFIWEHLKPNITAEQMVGIPAARQKSLPLCTLATETAEHR